jgi:hypothetical protein
MTDHLESLRTDDVDGSNTLALLVSSTSATSPLPITYMGMSLGGAAVGTTALMDRNHTVCAINLDGAHQSSNMMLRSPPVPLLVLTSNPIINEFNYYDYDLNSTHPPTCFQYQLPGMEHIDFTDAIYLPEPYRTGFGGGTLDYELISRFVRSFVVEFLKGCYDDDDDDNFDGHSKTSFPSEQLLEDNPNVTEVDLTYVVSEMPREWKIMKGLFLLVTRLTH